MFLAAQNHPAAAARLVPRTKHQPLAQAQHLLPHLLNPALPVLQRVRHLTTIDKACLPVSSFYTHAKRY